MEMNTANLPAPNEQRDFYDWDARRSRKCAAVVANGHELIFLGDSITHFFEEEGYGLSVWNRRYSSLSVLNLGYGWDMTQNLLWRLQNGEFEAQQPRVVVLNIGTNNLTGNDAARANTPSEIIEGIEAINGYIHEQSPETMIVVMGLFPRALRSELIHRQVSQANALMAESFADRKGVHYLDIGEHFFGPDGEICTSLMEDRCHPTQQGYDIWVRELDRTLSEFLW